RTRTWSASPPSTDKTLRTRAASARGPCKNFRRTWETSAFLGQFICPRVGSVRRRRERRREIGLLQHLDGLLGRALGARDAPAQLGRILALCLEQARRPDERLLGEQARRLGVEALVAGRLDELLDKEEDVGGAGSGDRRDRVDAVIAVDLDDGSDGLKEAAHDRHVVGGCAGSGGD